MLSELKLKNDLLSRNATGFSNGEHHSAKGPKRRYSEFWFEEDGLFNLDDEGRAEKQQCAIAASNIIRNFSFMPENEVIMAQHRHCMETLFQCVEDQNTGDNHIITSCYYY